MYFTWRQRKSMDDNFLCLRAPSPSIMQTALMAQVINDGNHVQFYDPGILLATLIEQRLGTLTPSKTNEFSEKFQTNFDPPPHFRKVILRISRQNCDKSAYVHMEELLCILWSYFPWDACSTNVQHGNRVKTYHKKTFLYHFHGQKALFKGPNFAI